MENTKAKNYATASLVLGIISIALWFFGATSVISVVLGIVGIVLANKSKTMGYLSGVRTAGFVCSLIGLVVGAIVFVYYVMVVGFLASIAMVM